MNNLMVIAFLSSIILASGCAQVTETLPHDTPTGMMTSEGENWCQTGTNWETSNPRTGEQASFSIEGEVQHDGKETCKAVMQSTENGSEHTVEYFFTQDSEYIHYLIRDQEGNLQYELKIDGENSTQNVYGEQN
jgi:hypothetical protein